MKPVGKDAQQKGPRRRYSLGATWQAICHLPTDHFPLMLAGVHPIAAFFILRRLKRLGFSNTKVTSSANGIVVHAQR